MLDASFFLYNLTQDLLDISLYEIIVNEQYL